MSLTNTGIFLQLETENLIENNRKNAARLNV